MGIKNCVNKADGNQEQAKNSENVIEPIQGTIVKDKSQQDPEKLGFIEGQSPSLAFLEFRVGQRIQEWDQGNPWEQKEIKRREGENQQYSGDYRQQVWIGYQLHCHRRERLIRLCRVNAASVPALDVVCRSGSRTAPAQRP